MQIYLFFKQYYIAMWNNLALYLSKKWMHPDTASILSLFFIFPIFYLLDLYIDNLLIFTVALFFAINMKLVLNAVDWIIARDQKVNTRMWMFLNVWTDIGPDLFIIYIILNKIWVWIDIVNYILITVLVYLVLEFLFIILFNKQNLCLWWKESRTFFYILIWIITYFSLPFISLLYFYILILIIHNAWFFINKYRA